MFRNKRILRIAAAVVGAVLFYAWFDGGEEPLRPITDEIDVPGEAQ